MRIGGGDLPMLAVDPKNPDIVYSTSIVTCALRMRGRPGQAFEARREATITRTFGSIPQTQKRSHRRDQGAIITVNGGETWSSWYNQPTAQIYHVSVSNDFPYKICGGQQESGSVCTLSRGNDGAITFRDWRPVGAIEYGYVAPDPVNSDIISGRAASKFRNSTGAQEKSKTLRRFPSAPANTARIALNLSCFLPLILEFSNTTANVLFKTTDGGENWQVHQARSHA